MKTQPFLVALDSELRGERSGNKRRKELFLSVFRGRDGERGSVYFDKKHPPLMSAML